MGTRETPRLIRGAGMEGKGAIDAPGTAAAPPVIYCLALSPSAPAQPHADHKCSVAQWLWSLR